VPSFEGGSLRNEEVIRVWHWFSLMIKDKPSYYEWLRIKYRRLLYRLHKGSVLSISVLSISDLSIVADTLLCHKDSLLLPCLMVVEERASQVHPASVVLPGQHGRYRPTRQGGQYDRGGLNSFPMAGWTKRSGKSFFTPDDEKPAFFSKVYLSNRVFTVNSFPLQREAVCPPTWPIPIL
jgi:hypothetical protein